MKRSRISKNDETRPRKAFFDGKTVKNPREDAGSEFKFLPA